MRSAALETRPCWAAGSKQHYRGIVGELPLAVSALQRPRVAALTGGRGPGQPCSAGTGVGVGFMSDLNSYPRLSFWRNASSRRQAALQAHWKRHKALPSMAKLIEAPGLPVAGDVLKVMWRLTGAG